MSAQLQGQLDALVGSLHGLADAEAQPAPQQRGRGAQDEEIRQHPRRQAHF